MFFDHLLFSKYVSSLDESALLNEVEGARFPSISAIQLVVECRVVENPLAQIAALIRGLNLTKLFQLQKILRFVVSFDHHCFLVDLELTRLLQ